MTETPWIGVDLDGTLALYENWLGPSHIGEPVPLMVARVKQWLEQEKDVRIFTARVSIPDGSEQRLLEAIEARKVIRKWCKRHIGQVLPVTCCKDYGMIELYDDRAVAVEHNTGRLLSPSTRGLED